MMKSDDRPASLKEPSRFPLESGKKFLVVILGPTAVGKTALSIEVAKGLETEIISADSRQFFKEMNIGTSKPNAEELISVKHHFINSISVEEEYNVGMFERDALNSLKNILSLKRLSPALDLSSLPVKNLLFKAS